jgi:TfoX/Sxy family transcriptional regulator of competence genes
MAWVKIPQENHPLFRDCLPRDPRVSTVNMFGGVAAKVKGQMFAGLFARGAVVKLAGSDQRAALAIDGATMFDPMGNGRIMRDTVFLPESVLEEPEELRAWLRKAFDYTATLPAKTKRTTKKAAAKPRATKKTRDEAMRRRGTHCARDVDARAACRPLWSWP